jgi:hypothetical protein
MQILNMYRTVHNVLAKVALLLAFVWEMPSSNLGWVTNYPD